MPRGEAVRPNGRAQPETGGSPGPRSGNGGFGPEWRDMAPQVDAYRPYSMAVAALAYSTIDAAFAAAGNSSAASIRPRNVRTVTILRMTSPRADVGRTSLPDRANFPLTQAFPSNRLVTEPSSKTSWMARASSGAMDSTVSCGKRF